MPGLKNWVLLRCLVYLFGLSVLEMAATQLVTVAVVALVEGVVVLVLVGLVTYPLLD